MKNTISSPAAALTNSAKLQNAANTAKSMIVNAIDEIKKLIASIKNGMSRVWTATKNKAVALWRGWVKPAATLATLPIVAPAGVILKRVAKTISSIWAETKASATMTFVSTLVETPFGVWAWSTTSSILQVLNRMTAKAVSLWRSAKNGLTNLWRSTKKGLTIVGAHAAAYYAAALASTAIRFTIAISAIVFTTYWLYRRFSAPQQGVVLDAVAVS